ncbi:MAG: UDP binding domain-containing protein [Pseudoramibacter sp.]
MMKTKHETLTQDMSQIPVGVIGLTVTGLAWAAVLAEKGLEVLASDPDEDTAAGIQEELLLPGVEPGLEEAVKEQIDSKQLTVLSQPRMIYRRCRFITLCCMTPGDEANSPSLRFCKSVVRQAAFQCPEETVIAVKTVLPPGGIRHLQETADAAAKDRDDGLKAVRVAALPELYDEGHMLKAMRGDGPIVVGADKPYAALTQVLSKLDPIGRRTLFCTPEEAEAAAVSDAGQAAFEQILANYFQDIAASRGADGGKVAQILGKAAQMRRRFSPKPYRSVGAGGRRLAQEMANLAAYEKDGTALVKAMEKANSAHYERVKAWLLPLVKKQIEAGGRIAVLGLSNAPGTDDLRETPAVELLKALAAPYEDQAPEGDKPFALYLPWGADQAKWRLFRTRDAFDFCETAAEATQNAAMVLVLGTWPGIGRMLTPALAKRMAGKLIVDTTGTLDRGKAARLGLKPVTVFEKVED